MDQQIKDALVEICNESMDLVKQEGQTKVIIYSPDVATRRHLNNLFLNHPYKFNGQIGLGIEDFSYYNPNRNPNPQIYSLDLQKMLMEKGISGICVTKNSRNP